VKCEKLKKYFLISVLLTVFCLLSVNAFALDMKRKVLPNGLTVLQSENKNLPIVMATLMIKAGQRHEPAEKAGLANITSRLLAEGTKTRTPEAISDEIDFIGASIESSAASDFITVTLSVLKKDVDRGFELFSDILLNPSFPQTEIERIKERIKGIIRQREEDPAFLAGRAFRKEVFGAHPYGRVVEGTTDTIDRITRKDILKFYSDYFSPNNSILSVSGDLSGEELDLLITKYMGIWKDSDVPELTLPERDGERTRKVIKIDRDLTQANIVLGNPGIGRNNPDFYAVSVMNYIFGGGGFSSRLMKSVRAEKGLAYDVRSLFAAQKEAGHFQIVVQTKNESANVAIADIITQINSIRNEKVSDDELAEAKSYLTGSFPRRLDTNRKIADFFASAEFFNLGIDYVEKYPGYINVVTKDDVLRVAKKYLDPDNFILVVVADQKKAILEY
jgi:zinc protease